jgi:tetratricopeptide (TPR) repeat protein
VKKSSYLFGCILPYVLLVCLSSRADVPDNPAEALRRSFEAAKNSLASGALPQARALYIQTIVIGLRQLANLDSAETHFDDAFQLLDEAAKLAPEDPEIGADLAVAKFRAGDTRGAQELARTVVAAHPEHARAHNILGRINLFYGDFDSAITELKASVDQQSDFETAYFLGIAYLRAKRLPEAQDLFVRLQNTMGDSAALHVLFGRAYTIGRYPEQAVAEFTKAIQLDPKYPRAHSLLGYAQLEFRGEESYPFAREQLNQELRLHPPDYNTLLLLGISDVALRDFAEGEAVLLKAQHVRPEEPFPYLYLGEIYSQTNRPKLAVDALNKFVSLVQHPDEMMRDLSRGYFLLGQSLQKLGRQDEARRAIAHSQELRETKFRYDAKHIFDEHKPGAGGESHASDRVTGTLDAGGGEQKDTAQKMVRTGVSFSNAPQAPAQAQSREYRSFVSDILSRCYNDLGAASANGNDFKGAEQFFKAASRWNQSLSGLDRNFGFASYRAEDYAQAQPPLQRHLTKHPDDAFARQILGMSYYMTEDYAKTVEVLRPFLNNLPDDPALLLAFGTALVRTHQLEGGEHLFRQLLEKNQREPAVHFLLGQVYAQQKDYPLALKEFTTALQLAPQLPEAHYYRGLVYLHQGDINSAEQEFRAELALRPGDPQTTYYLGYTLLANGSAEQAIPIFREVLQATPDYEPASFEMGRALLQHGDIDGAIANLEHATKLAPEHDAAFYQLSQAYRRAGRMQQAQQALATYQKLIESSRQKRKQTMENQNP